MLQLETNKIFKGDLVVETFPIGSYSCNCSLIYSIKTKEAIIVDPGNDYVTLKGLIEDRGLKVLKLIHTHAHFDHIGNSSEIKKLTGASIHLHRGDQFLYDNLQAQGVFFGQNVSEPLPIDGYIEDQENFYLEAAYPATKNLIQSIHTPGHTPGSCCFYSEFFDLPILFAGDTLFQNSIGRTDLPGGNSCDIISSIKKRLLILPEETHVITGHGPSTKINIEKKYNPFIH